MIKERIGLGVHATYQGNIPYHVYNWFYYKEAFSRNLVLEVIKDFGLEKGIVLDPFCGSGTTLLACKELGISSIGFDIQPSAVNASNAKVLDYDVPEVRKILKDILSKDVKDAGISENSFAKKAFSEYSWRQLSFYMAEIDMLPSNLSPFFRLALTRAAIRASSCFRDGAVIKFGKRKQANVKRLFRMEAGRMLKGYRIFGKISKGGYCKAFFGSSLRMPLKSGTIDAVITSPPYVNQDDYLTAYAVENLMAGKNIAKDFMESKAYGPELKGLPVPEACLKYFSLILESLREIFRVCRRGAKVAIVMGNGHVEKRVVESDVIAALLAEKAGFSARGIYVLNRRFALVGRTRKAGVLRESLVLLEKG